MSTSWNGDVQTGDLSQYGPPIPPTQQKAPGRVTVIPSPVGHARYIRRTEVRYGDYLGNIVDAERAITNVGVANTNGSEGTSGVWAVSLYFPNGPADFFHVIATAIPQWNIPFQFQRVGFMGQAMFNFAVDMAAPTRPRLILNSYYGEHTAPTHATHVLDASFSLGVWYEIVFPVAWSQSAAKGSFGVWLRKGSGQAVNVVPTVHAPTLYATQNGVPLTNEQAWCDIGLYRYGTPARQVTDVVYDTGLHRELTFAAALSKFPAGTWSSVAPSPTPAPTPTPAPAPAPPPPTSTGGTSQTWPGWESNVLTAIGAPSTAANIRFLLAWHGYELSAAHNNPLNTTQRETGSTSINSVGVQSYPSPAIGTKATAATLLNGFYPNIVAALKQGDPYSYVNKTAVGREITTWGTPRFAAAYLASGPSTVPPPPPTTGGGTSGAGGAGTSVGPFGPSTSLFGWNTAARVVAETIPTALSRAGYLHRHSLRLLHSGRKVG